VNQKMKLILQEVEVSQKVVGEVPVQVGSPEGGPPAGVSLRVFPNLRRTHLYKKLHACKQLSFLWECGNIEE
jgi:hypothetical protein